MLKAGGIWDGYDKLRDYHGKAANTNKVGESLSQWSSYLYRYHSADAPSGRLTSIELPGQYRGDRPPDPSTHVTIECISTQLMVMSSLRVPKRVTLHGSDQREYRFLCKGGEDLRLDQRVQIMFGAMNRTLDELSLIHI